MVKPPLKLQRVRTRTDEESGVTYYKTQVTLPGALVEEKEWGAGDELDAIDANYLSTLSPAEHKRMVGDAILLRRIKKA